MFVDRSPAARQKITEPDNTKITNESTYGLIEKLLSKSVGIYRLLRTSATKLAIHDGTGELKTSIDLYKKAQIPDPCKPPPEPLLQDFSDATATQLDDTTKINRDDTTIKNNITTITSDTVIRMFPHFFNGKDITYTILNSDCSIHSGFLFSDRKPDIFSTPGRPATVLGQKESLYLTGLKHQELAQTSSNVLPFTLHLKTDTLNLQRHFIYY